MNQRKTITQLRLKELFLYDEKTGEFTRRRNAGPALAGEIAGYQSGRYWKISVDGLNCYRHHLAWLYVHGVWPEDEIDHREDVLAMDAISNLRLATSQQNKRNRGANKNNILGIKGVFLCNKTGRYRARVGVDYGSVELGRFDSPEEARAARVAAESAIFGEFSKTNSSARYA